MFTGIVQAVGRVRSVNSSSAGLRLQIGTGCLEIGDLIGGGSIATNGVCLTVTSLTSAGYWADVSQETLACSTLGSLKVGDPVNLEKSLTLSTPLGGHLVSGHVDGVGEVIGLHGERESMQLVIRTDPELSRYIAQKGSICVDGVSLTVGNVTGERFDLNIIPHTKQQTILANYQLGSRVNLEVDLIARYLERLLLKIAPAADCKNNSISLDFLAEHGFLGGGINK